LLALEWHCVEDHLLGASGERRAQQRQATQYKQLGSAARNSAGATCADPGFGLCFGCVTVLTYSSTLRSVTRRKRRRKPGFAHGRSEASGRSVSFHDSTEVSIARQATRVCSAFAD